VPVSLVAFAGSVPVVCDRLLRASRLFVVFFFILAVSVLVSVVADAVVEVSLAGPVPVWPSASMGSARPVAKVIARIDFPFIDSFPFLIAVGFCFSIRDHRGRVMNFAI
jgi:hypothetical protein